MSRVGPRAIFAHLGLILGSLIVVALIAELFLSLAMPLLYRPRVTRLDRELGWYHTPKVSIEDALEGHTFRVSYNSRGYRGPDYSLQKPSGMRRVVVLGDSFVDGSEVDDTEVLTHQMQQRLDGAEVINLGVYGYQTAQQLMTLEREALRYSPDVIVLLAISNDLTGNVVGFESFGPAPRWVLDGDSIRFEDTTSPAQQEAFLRSNLPAPRWIHRNSMLYYMVNRHIYQRLAARRIAEYSNARLAAVPPTDRVELFRRIVLRMNRTAATHQIPLLVVFGYMKHELEQDASPFADLPGTLMASGVRTLDLRSDLRAAERAGPTHYYQYDIHWNARGHALVAEILAPAVREILAGGRELQTTDEAGR
jgi:lysophospholipase L1-like esterase